MQEVAEARGHGSAKAAVDPDTSEIRIWILISGHPPRRRHGRFATSASPLLLRRCRGRQGQRALGGVRRGPRILHSQPSSDFSEEFYPVFVVQPFRLDGRAEFAEGFYPVFVG